MWSQYYQFGFHSLLSLLFLVTSVNGSCYEHWPAFPPPSYDTQDPILQRAFSSINASLDELIADTNFDQASFSVEVTSKSQTLWSKHHTARDRNESRHDVDVVDGDSLYRIASITKTFTVLGILYQHAAGNLSLDDSIDVYLEELRGEQPGSIPWKDITLRSLASQLSGIPREFAQSDLINRPDVADEFGLPPVSHKGLIDCDENVGYDPPCGPEDLFRAMKSKQPLFAPNQKSTYSNVNFELLGLVLENVTGISYNAYMEDAIFKPLGMTRSNLTTPPDSYGVIPKGRPYWGIDEGVQNPTGGIYSSSTDLSKYLRYILGHYNGITHALNWLHPVSWAEGLQSFYGMPWEIFRTDTILPHSRRPVTFVGKGGGLPGYSSLIYLVPEYDIGITLLVADDQSDYSPNVTRTNLLNELREIVTVGIIRAAEEVALKQLEKRYAGLYIPTNSSLNTSLTLSVNHNGLSVSQFISNGTDVLSRLIPIFAPISEGYAQLMPTLLYEDEKAQKGEKWRMQISRTRPQYTAEIWDNYCNSDVDLPSYAGKPINEAIIWGSEGGPAEIIESPAFRINLTRKDSEGLHGGREDQLPIEMPELR